MKTKVQDAYSMRSTPQVIGAPRDAVAYARKQVEIELNGVGDNPIFVAERDCDSPAPTSRARRSRCRWTWSAPPSPWCACCPSAA